MLLLKFPYPFRAAVTVCSDTHATAPESFEAVHRLVNDREMLSFMSEQRLDELVATLKSHNG